MSIQINGTTVIDNSKAITNVVSYSGPGVASQSEAESGSNNNQLMTPLRVRQAIDAAGGSVIKRIQRGTTSFDGFGKNINISISPSFNLSKTIINQSVRSNVNGYIYLPSDDIDGSAAQTNGSASIRIVNSTTMTLSTGVKDLQLNTQGNQSSWYNNSGKVDWELIEYK